MREIGSPLAIPGRAPSAGPDHPSTRGRRLSPSPPEDAPPGTPPATRDGLDPPVGPPSASNPASSLRRPRRSPQGGRSHVWTDDSSRNLVSGQARHGDTVLQVQNVPDGHGVPGAVSGSANTQCYVPQEGVVGHDGAPSSDDGVPLSQEALRATRFDWASSLSYDSLVSRIKLVAQRLGLPADNYSGHSLRAGGATDLFIARVAYFII